MSKKMLINATHPEENRVAIVEDGILTELDIEIAGKEQTKGNIYKAVVVRVEPGLQAAFVDYGAERLGFLQMGDIHPSLFKPTEDKGRPRITDILRRGQELLVQVVKEERGTKGAALTTFLSLPGRFMVLMPDSDTKGVSRKIEDEPQRKKLKAAMASLDLPEHMGYIVRTAGIGQTNEELKRDFDYLVRVWENLQAQSRQAKAPALIYKESNLVIRSIRDYFSAEMDEVLVDDPKVCQEAKEFFQQVMPEFARLVKLHQERRPIFSRYQIEEQIETIVKNKVTLPSGGSIVIDSTEALVAVDVNSGKMAGEQGVEGTAYKTNLEAADEVGRQLRLRDLGGLIVIDFIDMRDRKHMREVEKRLKDALKNDKARVTIGKISQFGLLEMSRQRIKAALAEGSYLPCPHCQGTGRVKNVEAQTVALLRKIHAGIAKGHIGRIEAEIPLEVATHLLNAKREELLDLERGNQVTIFVKGRPDFIAGHMEIVFLKREKDETPQAEPVEAFSLVPQREPLPAPAPVEMTTAMASEVDDAEESTKKKRKRKRKKKTMTEEAVESASTAIESASTAGAETEPAPVTIANGGASDTESVVRNEGDPGEDGAKRKRKRRRKKKKGDGDGLTAEVSTPEIVASDSTVASAFSPALAVVAGEPAPADSVPADAGTLARETLTNEEEQTKKKRRRRKKKKPSVATVDDGAARSDAASTVEPSAPSTESSEPATDTTAAPATIPAPQPKKRAPRVKSVKEVAVAPEAVVAESRAEGDKGKPPEEPTAPAKTKSGRRAHRTKVESSAEPAAAAMAPAAEVKPRRQPARARKTTDTAPVAEEPAVTAESAPAPAKKRTPRRKSTQAAKEAKDT